MKQSGECPKCHGRNIWNNSQLKESAGLRGPKTWIMVKGAFNLRRAKLAHQDEYVCLDCGYNETYVESKGIESIK
ncbi:MAG: hypothetical protein P1Q69_06910 [Candidatus Thorarchaeota archaeon]|nr:hypothetical protein [Candidatus Thorarchaeota archaeon]